MESRYGLNPGLPLKTCNITEEGWMPRRVGDDSVTTALGGAVRRKQQGIQPCYRKGHKPVVFLVPAVWFEGYFFL